MAIIPLPHIVQNIKRIKVEKRKSLPTLSVMDMVQLMAIFKEKHWNLDIQNPHSIYNRYIHTLSNFNEQQKKIILSLTQRFIHIPQAEYAHRLLVPLQKLIDQNNDKILYFVRCVSEKDENKLKSCDAVIYLLKGTTFCAHLNMSNCVIVSNIDRLNADEINMNKALLVFVDDFIGTGFTAMEAWRYLKKRVPAIQNCSNVAFLTIVIMKEGEALLSQAGFKVYAQQILNKGITDFYQGEELKTAVQTMESIECTIPKLLDTFKFGYQQSEGLICMERCPNNTFPIYWLPYNSPYERHVNEI